MTQRSILGPALALLLAGCATASQLSPASETDASSDEDDNSPEAYGARLERERRKLMTQAERDEEDDTKALESLTASDVVAASLTKFGKDPATYCPWSTNELTLTVKNRQGRVLTLGRRELGPLEPTVETNPPNLAGDGLQLAQVMGAGIGVPPAKLSVTVSFKGTAVTAREDFVPEWGCTSGVVFNAEAGSRGKEGAEGRSAPRRGQGGTGENGGTGGRGGDAPAVTAEVAFVRDSQQQRFVLLVAEGPGGEKKWALRPAGDKVAIFAKGGRGGSGGPGGRGGPVGACPVGSAGDGGNGGAGGDAGASGKEAVRCEDDVERKGRAGRYGSTGPAGKPGGPGQVTRKSVSAPKLKRIAVVLAAGSGFKLDDAP